MKVTLHFDRAKVFDALVAMNGNYSPLGCRLVGILLGEPGALDRVALLGAYGIEVGEAEENHSLPTSVDDAVRMKEIAERYLKEQGYSYFAEGEKAEAKPKYYECPVCGSNDLNKYTRCQHAGCPDGRDR